MTSVELKKQLDELDLEMVMGIYIMDTPNCYNYDGYTVNFSDDFYKEHKKIIDDFAKKLCSYKRNWIKCLYFVSFDLTSEYLNLLKDNETIEHLSLYNFKLTKEEFDILKQNKNLKDIDSSSVSEELSECYDKRLGFIMKRDVTKYKRVKDIIYDKELNFYEDLTEEQVQTICSYLDKRKIKGDLSFSSINNGRLIKKIIDKFESIESDETESTISIEIKNRELFDYSAFNDLEQNSRIRVITETDEPVDMNMFIKMEEKISEIIKDLKEHENELSPFEKLLWLYNIVETYREHKQERTEEDWKISRFLNKLLFSNKMVCVGFSHLLSELSQRSSLKVWENPALAYCKNKSDVSSDNYNHQNNLVFLEDEKYDIKGIYLLDADHDNHQINDLFVFNHFLITPEEYDKHVMQIFAAGYSLLSIKDKEEFIKILKNDELSLESLIRIISTYYKNHELFKVRFDSGDAWISYYKERAELLYELAQSIIIEPISEDKLRRALVHIEKIKNPNIGVEELEEKLNQTFELYRERHKKIYTEEAVNQKRTLH